ncbi:hypothetical protein ALI144C_52035 [Actinosynnema sp. ALI-1.44]|uniref:hypothetical protein n=1 Tax=Actinosynnema sp. ALI-1.44 TaxID=1933779 RepID=UPI00097CB821|nr:hypothetical protein [Actinosynnema sp. ALI-1.44]ONI71082.1 hypothetical protein ALI144C_52035 [Actinosynnema sp. ALI-1.44]
MSDEQECSQRVIDMVKSQAPKVFAVVIESGCSEEARVVAWGMTLADGAYMTSVEGNNQWLLADPDNALMYIRHAPEDTPYLVWAA